MSTTRSSYKAALEELHHYLSGFVPLTKYEFAQFFAPGSPYRKGIQDRATRIRKYAEALERTALIGSNGALDLLDVAALRPLERAIREHEELIAFGRETGLIGRGQP